MFVLYVERRITRPVWPRGLLVATTPPEVVVERAGDMGALCVPDPAAAFALEPEVEVVGGGTLLS